MDDYCITVICWIYISVVVRYHLKNISTIEMNSKKKISDALLPGDELNLNGEQESTSAISARKRVVEQDLESAGNNLNQEKLVYASTFKSQMRGLFKKNYALQSKQVGTNICQVSLYTTKYM